MHTHQTVDFVRSKHDKWLKFNHFQSTIMEALEMLNDLVDESDPDTDLPNIVHAFQTAERIRQDHPDKEWFQLCGLIHDLGKVMAFYGEPQWCVVGDTFPVGCKPGQSVVFGDDSFKDNVDLKDERYNTKTGMYTAGCGMENVLMSWGHDEYMYHVILNHMKKTGTKIPEAGLWSVRFHSCYPWHTGNDYKFLESEKDKEILDWVLEFNKYDLYTKSADVPDIEKLKPYYQSLIDKYLPGLIDF
eukprot:TRINITY_DN28451_c0_g1_i1.p1 TRINITY_DN28451_c0_g1~~TRINITY_DN28451_c0_g1_i1.p1  ORF type:complete len:282 (-),score=81.62 TRINITY_DN28451_c0_g1_i1:118-849(-)